MSKRCGSELLGFLDYEIEDGSFLHTPCMLPLDFKNSLVAATKIKMLDEIRSLREEAPQWSMQADHLLMVPDAIASLASQRRLAIVRSVPIRAQLRYAGVVDQHPAPKLIRRWWKHMRNATSSVAHDGDCLAEEADARRRAGYNVYIDPRAAVLAVRTATGNRPPQLDRVFSPEQVLRTLNFSGHLKSAHTIIDALKDGVRVFACWVLGHRLLDSPLNDGS